MAKAGRGDDRAAFARRPENIGKVAVSAPQTGDEFLASLDDGREVYIYGERVKDVTDASGLPQHRAHDGPALRRAARPGATPKLTDPHRHRQRRLHPRVLPRAAHVGRVWSPAATPSPTGRGSPTAGWAARPTTRRRSSARSAPTPTSTSRTRTTPSAGTSTARSACRSSTTPSSTRRSTATARRTRSATCAATSRRRPTPASSSAAPRWWRPARR